MVFISKTKNPYNFYMRIGCFIGCSTIITKILNFFVPACLIIVVPTCSYINPTNCFDVSPKPESIEEVLTLMLQNNSTKGICDIILLKILM